MLTPRSYISYSSMTLFERDREAWADLYLYEKKQHETKNMRYGSKMADALELDEATGDAMLDLMVSRLPKFEIMDKPFECPLKNGKNEIITLLIKPDTAMPDLSAFKEYKTSVRKWTQKMANESAQITFYATGIWLLKGKIPHDIELVNVPVRYQEDGSLTPTGEIHRFRTHRTLTDIIKMTARVRRNWAAMNDFCEQELL